MNRLVPLLALLAPACATPRSPYLDAAQHAATWIDAAPAEPNAAATGKPADLYYGTAGIVLFHLEAHRATGDERYLAQARAGADALLAALPGTKEPGLYTGIAGIGFALLEAAKATGDARYRDGATRSVALLAERARPTAKGVEWNDTTDIIAGGAGTGLFLLQAAHELNDPGARELALSAGRHLVELGRPEAGGLKWAMDPRFARLMPNFSHGTAGVCYFLATLHGETRDATILEAALAGARYLLAIADQKHDGCLVFHHEPGGKDLFYLGWCHGPAGTAALFHRLFQVTGDPQWQQWVERGARSVLASGIPEQRTPGFWDNMSQCCGDAGVAEWFLDLHRLTGKPEYLSFARRLAHYLLARATRSEAGWSWLHAEQRVRPEAKAAQKGYMQGAAGIGMLLLHLHEHDRGITRAIRLPDSPW
jgi:lantibiotic modifying enzyme